jgi:predicted GH43/DUF377 family glycosyl hydrolase
MSAKGHAAALTFLLAFLLAFLLTGCGRYADFTLPQSSTAAPPTATATFTPQPQPVLSYGAPGAWDSSDILNPSVVFHANQYWNFYSGFDGKVWSTGLAISPDGSHWTRRGKILSPDSTTWEGDYIAANGSAIWRDREFLYWYQAGPRGEQRIGLARSPDGVNWRKEPAPVLERGPYRSWDERDVADPYVIQINGLLYMYYLGQDRAGRQQIGLARSNDGIHWEKLRSNPVLELAPPGSGSFAERGLGEPAVLEWNGRYWMLFTGRDAHEYRRIGAAWSSDGVHWHQQPQPFAGNAAWDGKVLCDPSVLIDHGVVRVWFGGGDIASPDERLHGQIGTGTLQ